MSKLVNLEIEEVSMVSEPANQHSTAKITKSRGRNKVKVAKEEEAEEEEVKQTCPECEGKEDCVCPEAEQEEVAAEEEEAEEEEVKQTCPECEGKEDCVCPDEEVEEVAQSADYEDPEEVDLSKSVQLEKTVADLTKQLEVLKYKELVKEKTDMVKSLGAPAELVEELADTLTKQANVEGVIVKLLKTMNKLQKMSKAYEEVGYVEESNKISIVDKAQELIKSGKCKSYAEAIAKLGGLQEAE